MNSTPMSRLDVSQLMKLYNPAGQFDFQSARGDSELDDVGVTTVALADEFARGVICETGVPCVARRSGELVEIVVARGPRPRCPTHGSAVTVTPVAPG